MEEIAVRDNLFRSHKHIGIQSHGCGVDHLGSEYTEKITYQNTNPWSIHHLVTGKMRIHQRDGKSLVSAEVNMSAIESNFDGTEKGFLIVRKKFLSSKYRI